MESVDNVKPPNAVRQRLDRTRNAVSDRFDRVRERWSLVDRLATVVAHDAEVGGGVMAGALAFRLFLFLVPYVLFMFTAFGTASTVTDRSAADLASSVGISGLLAKGVINAENLTSGQKWMILIVSGYALVLAARSLVKTLVTAMCLAWRIPRVRMKSTTAGLVFIAYFTVVTVLTSEIARLRNAAPAPGVGLTVAWLAVPLLSIWWLMARLPHRDAPGWALIPGAAIASVGFQVMHVLTVMWFVPSATSKTETYGVIGISLATLAWCYISSRLVVGCTILNAALWMRYQHDNPGLILSTIEPGAKLLSRIKVWLSSALELFR